ncbi:DNA polymerase [Fluviispira vulneris]|uniref:DNA polymerase n=1 Tax=Fluviispira vulneris TaxID=2763012 RepID=UPI001648B6AD|nr:DNA polymerase [Fluviispira vulneris]
MLLTPIDFEFFNANERNPTLVCAVVGTTKYWLLDGSDTHALIDKLRSIKRLTAYYAIAEARCLQALGLEPFHDYEWVDLYAEFRMLQNSNNKFSYGSYINKKGVRTFSTPPPASEYGDVADEDEGEDDESHAKIPSNYVNAAFKLLGVVEDTERKNKMRDIILSKDIELISEYKEEILEYCYSDVHNLIPMYEQITHEYYSLGLRNFESDMLKRGRYAAATAMCESEGISINYDLLKRIIEKTPELLQSGKLEVNNESQKLISSDVFLKEYQKPDKIHKNGRVHTYKPEPPRKDTKAIQECIKSFNLSSWPLTDSKNKKDKSKTTKPKKEILSTAKKTLESYRHLPFVESLYKYNKLDASLKWFSGKNSNGFFDAYSFRDSRVRPFYGIFGTQTGRNAAKAKTFPLAMSNWLRAIIQPPEGYVIIGADFSQQEVAVAAWLSQDNNLIDAYNSGDVYLAFAKMAGMVPQDATKASHEAERDLCKSTVLGLQFGMGAGLLQQKLTYDCKRSVTLEETLELINHHKTVFKLYWKWVHELREKYKAGVPVVMPQWVLWCDNPRITSVSNAPVQGTGAAITRESIVLGTAENVRFMCSLHDACYVYAKAEQKEEEEAKLRKIMRQATENILGQNCIDIRVDVKTISHGDVWIDKKGQKDWQKISALL